MKVLVFIATILLIIEAKLYQVVSLTRHGARYHVNAFGDGNDTKPLWGELTSVGMRQHQRLGQLLRK
jgi:broad specificity phosphatase PhoE